MNLTEGDIVQHIRKIAIPACIGFFCSTMLNVVDTLFAGLVSTEALAALSISFPVFFIIIAFNSGLSTGSSALISNAIGEKNIPKARHLSGQVIAFGVLLYLFVAPLTYILTPFLFKMMGAKGDYLNMALSYMNIIIFGSIFFILMYASNSILLATGNTRAFRNFLVAGVMINALLDPWFLFGGFGLPAMGLPGIALATVVTMLLGAIYITKEAIKEGLFETCTLQDFIPKARSMYAIAQQSFPASLNMMTIGIGIIIITSFIKEFGTAAVAAYGITTRIEQIALLPTIGLTIAALAIIGQNNGARKYSRVKKTLLLALKYGLLLISIGAVFMFCFANQLVGFFTSDQDVIEVGSKYLRIAAATSWSYVILSICISALQGMKRPLFPLIIGLGRQIIAPPLVFYTLIHVFQFGIFGIWWGIFSIAWTAAIIVFFYTKHTLHHHYPVEDSV